jgi:malate dehydrogenase
MARKGKVAVVGAGFYGSTTAQRLAEYDIFDEVVLTDIIEGKPEGLALDMNQSRPVEGFDTKITGQTTGPAGEGYEAIAGSGIVIVTAGLARKPGMSRMDLIEVNAKIVRAVVENVVKHAPEAVLIVVSNPLDEMTALAAKVSGFPSHRVMGQAGMLDTARFSYFVAERLGVPVSSVRTGTPWSRCPRRARWTARRWPTGCPPPASRRWWSGPGRAARRSSRCSRPDPRTTRRPRPRPGWPGP